MTNKLHYLAINKRIINGVVIANDTRYGDLHQIVLLITNS